MLPQFCAWFLLAFLESAAVATPTRISTPLSHPSTDFSIPLTRRTPNKGQSTEELAAWAFRQRQSLLTKYGVRSTEKVKRGTSGRYTVFPGADVSLR
jgi:hypothetical protein